MCFHSKQNCAQDRLKTWATYVEVVHWVFFVQNYVTTSEIRRQSSPDQKKTKKNTTTKTKNQSQSGSQSKNHLHIAFTKIERFILTKDAFIKIFVCFYIIIIVLYLEV